MKISDFYKWCLLMLMISSCVNVEKEKIEAFKMIDFIERMPLKFEANYVNIDSICESHNLVQKGEGYYSFFANNGLLALQKGDLFDFRPSNESKNIQKYKDAKYYCKFDLRGLPLIVEETDLIQIIQDLQAKLDKIIDKEDSNQARSFLTKYKCKQISKESVLALKSWGSIFDESKNDIHKTNQKYWMIQLENGMPASTFEFVNTINDLYEKVDELR